MSIPEPPQDALAAEPVTRRSHFVDFTPLKASPAFARLWIGTAISGIGSQLTVVAIGLQVYEITSSTFAVALVGGFSLVPMIVFGIYAGMLNDAFDRRTILIVTAVIGWSSTVALAILAWTGIDTVWPLYLLAVISAVAASAGGSTRFAILPRLLDERLLPAAAALNGISFGAMLTIGPALAGVLVAAVGYGWTYSVDVLLFAAGFLGIVTLPRIVPLGDAPKPGWESIKSGAAFLRRAPNIRMSFIVDIIAMTFGRPQVLFPAVGALAIGGGPVTVGILVAAGAVGTFLSSVFSGRLGGVRRHGVAIGWSIAVYGAFVAAFGIVLAALATGWFGNFDEAHVNVPALVVASVMMAGTGASDNVSSIFRMTMVQVAAPDEMRGRLQGIFTVVVTGGPRIGDLYMGGFAALASLWLPPIVGGMVIIALMAVILRINRGFREYDGLEPTP